MSDALHTYSGNPIDLPIDLDIDKPVLWSSFSQKRFKTGTYTEQPFFAQPRFPDYQQSMAPSFNTTNPIYDPPKLSEMGHFYSSETKTVSYNPAKDFPTYSKKSSHLNELSMNLRNKQMANDSANRFKPEFVTSDPLKQLNLRPLRSSASKPSQGQPGDNTMLLRVDPVNTSQPITGSNDSSRTKPLSANELKPPSSLVYKNTRSSVTIKLETSTDCKSCLPDSKHNDDEDEPLEEKIRRYESMVKAVSELKAQIEQKISRK